MILDFLFPKRCVECGKFGIYLCLKCRGKLQKVEFVVCPCCLRNVDEGAVHPKCKNRTSLDGLMVGYRYRGPMRKLIKKLKYRSIFDLASTIVDLAGERVKPSLKGAVFVPVPLYKNRQRLRGFNQSELIAKGLSKQFLIPYANLLIRMRETKAQANLGSYERAINLKDAFLVVGKVKGRRILLVDDIYTTGSTMNECARVLKRAGAAEVFAVVAALG